MAAATASEIVESTTDLRESLLEIIARLRAARTDLADVEAKAAKGGLPKSVNHSLSAFANTRGGLVILGLSDPDFLPVPIDAGKLAHDLDSVCASALEPPLRPEIEIVDIEERPLVVARIPSLSHTQRPCYVKSQGLQGGAYRRVHDGDHRMNTYEVQVMLSGRGQPVDDAEAVEGARIEHLDPRMTDDLLRRVRDRRGAAFAEAADHEVLHMLSVLSEPRADSPLTLAGLLAIGRYPQQFFPQLGASLVVLPTADGAPLADGTRFLDNQVLDGPIPEIVSNAVRAMRLNMRRRAVVEGAGRSDVWDYPDVVIRELVANALTHRDYHPMARGSQVRISLYPDRLVVASPGGLHGAHAGATEVTQLIESSLASTRNVHLARILEDVIVPGTADAVCENRGSGLRAAVEALRGEGRKPPSISDRVGEFVVTVRDGYFRTGESAPGGGDRLAGEFEHDPWRSPASDKANQGSIPDVEPDGEFARFRALLADGPHTSTELAEAFGVSRQAVLRRLRRLRAAGLVEPTLAEPRTRGNKWRLTRGS